MKVNRIISIILILCCAAALAGCAQPSAEEPSPAAEEAQTAVREELPGEPANVEEKLPSDFDPDLSFKTTDRAGKEYDETVFAEAKLTVINFWEPWCNPCVGEMPDFQSLFEEYAEQGVNFIGVYRTEGMEEDIDAVLEITGVTYPILHYCDEFDNFQTGYVPGTVFFDKNGHILTHENEAFSPSKLPGNENAEWLSKVIYIGSANREIWDARIQSALNEK